MLGLELILEKFKQTSSLSMNGWLVDIIPTPKASASGFGREHMCETSNSYTRYKKRWLLVMMGRDKQTFKQAVIDRERGRLRAFRKTVRVRTVYWESIAKYKTSTKL